MFTPFSLPPAAVFDVSCGVLIKLLGNVLQDPTNPKKRSVRLENAKIRQAFTSSVIEACHFSILPEPPHPQAVFAPRGAMQLMAAAGFVEDGEGNLTLAMEELILV